MKNLFAFVLAFAMVVLFTTASYSQPAAGAVKFTAEDNYIKGLESDNLGVKTDCIYYLGKMKSVRAVEPLIGILKNAYTFNAVRVMAALALLQIEDPEGVSAVKYAADNCDCDQVKTLCNYFHKIHSMENNYKDLVAQLKIEKPRW